MDIRNILFPTDFSMGSGNALFYTLNIASKFKADITLLHTYDFPDKYSAVPAEQIFSMKDSLKKDAKDHIEKLIKQSELISPDIHLNYDIEFGFFTEHLLHVIGKKHVDFIAIGTKGVQGLSSILFGTNTSRILDISPCPVLVIPEDTFYKPINKILYLSKNLKEEVPYLQYIAQVSKVYNATIYVVHISDSELVPDNNFIDLVKEHVDYVPILFKCIEGKGMLKCIEEFASEESIDWIVMYMSHRDLLARIFGDNLTKEVIYNSNIPVLVFPEKFI